MTDPTSDEQAELADVRAAQRRQVLAMTPAERFALMDQLCREITWIAANAKRV